jgi:hypothetical protein
MILGVDLASKNNDYQEYLPRVTAADAYAWKPWTKGLSRPVVA